jgi:hypothetical protein
VIVKQAKDAARQWVIEEGTKLLGFSGAYLAGSTLWLPDNATLPVSSDVDVVIVLAKPPSLKLGKFIYRDVMLEVSYMPSDQLQSPEMILDKPHLAGSFSMPNLILDPSGHLTALQAVVSRDFAKRYWVHQRCQYAAGMVLGRLQALNQSEPFHEQVTAWLFGTSLTTYMLLVAGLKNPTVRRRYMATRELLAEYGCLDFYETLLEMLGCARMSRERVEDHLAALTKVFDVAKMLIKTPYRFASDISDVGRAIAIDGSQDLIERGYHREAIFYMVATYSRCQHILYHDAPVEIQNRFSVGYRQLVGDLGITSFADLQQRCDQAKDFLPYLWEMAETMMAANPGIED